MSEPFQNITIAKNKIRILNPCDSCPNECRPLHTKVMRGAKILVLTSGPNTYLRVARQLIMRDEAQRAFDTYAHKAGFVATDFIFHPIVKCYFDKESTPKKQRTNIELQCREFVLRVIEALKPEVIITLGVDALKTVYGKQKRVLKSRGQLEWIEDYQAYVYPMLDPEYVVMYPQNAKIFEADWMRLQSLRNNGYDEASTTQDLVGEYEIVDDLQFIVDADPSVIAFDTETEGLRWIAPDKDLLTMQFCWEPGKAYMLSWDHPDRPLPRRKRQRVKEQLRQILCKPGRSIVGHNLKYDAMWVWAKLGIRMRIDQDTLMLTTLLDENMVSKDLSTLTKVLLPHMAGYDDLFNRTYDKSDMASIPLDQILAYGCGDTDATLQIYEIQSERVYQDEALWNHYRTVSIPGLNMFMSMERFGMPVDESKLDELEVDLALYLESVYADLMDAIPQSIKIEHVSKGKALKFSRADFLIDILFRHPDGFRLTPRVFTKTTEKLAPELRVPSTSSKNHLPFFFDECPFTEQLAEYIKLERLLTTNVQGFRENYIIDGHVYPSYGLHVTVTGRSNSQDPNSQNYPKRGSFAKTYRSIFAAPPGKIIVQADLSQAELRIAADMANERTMLGIYRVNGDVHLSTALEASRMSKEEFDALSAEERDLSRFKAKAVNFGFLYGMWWRKFVLYAKTQYGVEFTEAEAQDLRESFFRLYSGLESWHEATRQFARRHKMVRSYSGRIRHLPMIDSVEDYIKQEAERQAINSPVQEFASTLGIVAASMIDQSIDPQYLSLGGFVHDALITYTNPEHVQWAAWTLKRYMENVPIRELFGRTMRVPIVADVSFGQDAGHQFEMKGLVTGEPYDFSRTKPEMDFRLPRQKIPPRDGRIVLPEYMRHAEYEGLV
jgi:uracil-DNA glycosylase family 4